MMAALYVRMCQISPRFHKFSKRVMYQFMAKQYQKDDWTFMNYGFAHLEDANEAPPLEARDEANRFCIQLYHHVANAVNLSGLKVLEVGSGRGGGAHYIKHYLKPRIMVGVDFSKNAVILCQKTHSMPGLQFIPGDAENLPFDNQCFDAVVNVESSHCYSAMDSFLAEVKRVLRPGGHFLFADFRDRERWDMLHEQLRRTDMAQIKQTDITLNVIAALDQDHERKLAQITRGAPKLFVKLLQEFAGSKGSRIYKQFKNRSIVYQSFVLQKAGG